MQELNLLPAVIIRNVKYWMTINANDMNVHLMSATNGDKTDLMYRQDNIWNPDEDFTQFGCMVKFYGRVVPVVS